MTGRLRPLVSGAPAGGEPIVEVRTAELALRARTRAGEEIELESGAYVVSAALPDGARPTRLVEVEEGETSEVVLEQTGPTDLPMDPEELLFGMELRYRYRTPSEVLLAWVKRLPARLAALREPVHARVAHVERQAGEEGDTSLGEAPRVIGGHKHEGRSELSLLVEPPSGLSVAQFGLRGEVPTNVMLPLHADDPIAACKLRVTYGRGRVEPVVVPTGSPEIELIAGYMRTGQVEAAAEVAVQAERVLLGKLMNPIGAALAGYALLRLGDTERLHHWPENLANWFQWLPDGAVVAGEQAAREGDEDRATEWFATALDRGYPIFTDGFSLIAARLREHAHSDELPEPLRLREDAFRRLIRMVPYVDFRQVVVTFEGLDADDPTASQQPLPRWPRRRSQGWKALRRP